ncbi:MAG: DUF554 domain-containing protein [Oscillospiraceae bacterium]|nr:DUF554 domain-containing protein [Oscillospiraceae bacterium]
MTNFTLDNLSFPFLGTIVNIIAVVIGGYLGLVFKKILSSKHTEIIMQGVGLAVMIVGLSGIFTSSMKVTNSTLSFENTLLMIVSLAIGGFIGSLLKIHERLERLSKRLGDRFAAASSSTFAEGFLTASLLFCVGAMAIIGSLEDGLNHNPSILISKSALDFISAMILASTLGAGVLASVVSVALYQGIITLLAFLLSSFLNGPVVAQMSLIGSILIVGLSLDILGLTKQLKVSNLLPAILIPVIYMIIKTYIFGL